MLVLAPPLASLASSPGSWLFILDGLVLVLGLHWSIREPHILGSGLYVYVWCN